LTERGNKLTRNERDEYGLSVLFKQVLRSYIEGIPHLLQLLRANFVIMQDVVAQTQGTALSQVPSKQQPLFNKDKPVPWEKRRYMQEETAEQVLRTLYRVAKDRAQYNLQEVRNFRKLMAQLVTLVQQAS